MVQFKVLKFSVLPNDAHANYANNAIETFEDAGEAVALALGPLLNEFKDWCALENIGIHWVRKDALTVLIVAADKDMDRALVGLLKYVRSLRYSSQPGFSAAAERVIIMLDGYGRVYEKAYEAQEGAVKAILWQFANTYAEDANLLSLGAWIADLTSTFEKFKLLLAQRDVHSLEKPTMPFKQVRKGVEGSYHKIVKVINAAALLNLQPEFAAVINKLNPEIDRLNTEFHRAKHDIAHAEPEAIPQQTYTGQAITPVPEVYYTSTHKNANETLRLVLGKDFTVSYKNNIQPGNAQCIIRGKGGYNGSKTVTFIISR